MLAYDIAIISRINPRRCTKSTTGKALGRCFLFALNNNRNGWLIELKKVARDDVYLTPRRDVPIDFSVRRVAWPTLYQGINETNNATAYALYNRYRAFRSGF